MFKGQRSRSLGTKL